ncbi:unnamed protein product [Orchesella dallaii]|uniref:Uncharacterized protein n=1 Tax=Orchesella dallaii TaxID=48710 RepID=A0ABP1QH97_9HEXA
MNYAKAPIHQPHPHPAVASFLKTRERGTPDLTNKIFYPDFKICSPSGKPAWLVFSTLTKSLNISCFAYTCPTSDQFPLIFFSYFLSTPILSIQQPLVVLPFLNGYVYSIRPYIKA